MNVARVFISFLFFLIALLVGFNLGTKIDLLESLIEISSLDSASLPDVPIPNNDQFNVLIIGINEIEQTNPQLESIWLAAYSELTHKMTFMPIFPSPDNPQQNQMLANAFVLEEGKPHKNFWNALKTMHLWWEGYILTNRSTTIDIVDMLDGIYFNDTLVNGNQTVSEISSWTIDPQSAVENQKILLEGICNRLAEYNTLNKKYTWEFLLTKPISSNFQTFLQIANWSSKFQDSENFSCEFPVSSLGQSTIISQ